MLGNTFISHARPPAATTAINTTITAATLNGHNLSKSSPWRRS
jgi:hypothetical protein